MSRDLMTAAAARHREFAVTWEGGRWAVKHGDGYLGTVASEAEALSIVRALLDQPAASPEALATDRVWPRPLIPFASQ